MKTKISDVNGVELLLVTATAALCSAACSDSGAQLEAPDRAWLAGDHHIHSQYSVLWNGDVEPPAPVLRGHGIYPIPHMALMSRYFGLDWSVLTDHGGRAHAKIAVEQAYPSLLIARDAVPDLIQFYGLELNPPGADHASIIVSRSEDESEQIYAIESRFDRSNGPGLPPLEPGANDEARMLEALEVMQAFSTKPLVIAHHPSRTASENGFGLTGPAELRAWNDVAPEIAIGMEGSPGHQAASLIPDGIPKRMAPRGQYGRVPTRGGFDMMSAELGGVWDSMLGEGRNWWITATSDAHLHWSEGGPDFWPGEYSKTYVYAEKNHSDILQALRSGRIFVTTGDLISELEVTISADGIEASVGETIAVAADSDLAVSIRVRDPEASNNNGDHPAVQRIDLIAGDIDPELIGAAGDSNPSTAVVRRFTDADWVREGEYLSMTFELEGISTARYFRIRGTSTGELEPAPDEFGEDPWQDLWFYSNPVFVYVQP